MTASDSLEKALSYPHGAESQFMKLLRDTYQRLAVAHVEEVERARQSANAFAHLQPVVPEGDGALLQQILSFGDPPKPVEVDLEDAAQELCSQAPQTRMMHLQGVRSTRQPKMDDDVEGSNGADMVPSLGVGPGLAGLASEGAAWEPVSTPISTSCHPLDVTVVEASGLRDADGMLFMGSSDPYCVCQVRNKPHTRFQTKVIKDNLRPVWNHEAIITDFHEGDIIDFTVYDSDFNVTSDDLLGAAQLSWVDIRDEDFFGSLALSKSRDATDESAGILVVQVIRKEDEANKERELANFQKLMVAARLDWPEIEAVDVDRICGSNSLSLGAFAMSQVASSHGAFVQGSGLQRYVVINPFSINAACWNLLGILCVLTDIFLVPLLLAFDLHENNATQMVSLIVSVYWTLNIPRSFVTGIFMSGVVELRISAIIKNYLKTWFLPDVALAAIDWIAVVDMFTSGGVGDEATLPKMVRIFRAVRFMRSLAVLRMFKLNSAVEMYVDVIALAPLRCFLNVSAIVAVMLCFCHYLGCAWYAIGLEGGTSGWVHRGDVGSLGTMYEYMSSIHWALTQFMPASSGIQAGTLSERSYVFAVDVVGFVTFSFFVSNVQMQLNSLKSLNADRMRQKAEMRTFFSDKKVPLSVATTVMNFVKKEQTVKKPKRIQDIQAFKCLPAELVRKLTTEVFRPHISPHPFMGILAHLDRRAFARMCHEAVQERPVLKGCKLFEQEAIATCMYFVAEGKFLYSRLVHVLELSVATWAGEPVLWVNEWAHRGTMVANGECLVLALSQKAFSGLLSGGGDRLREFAKAYAAMFVRSEEHQEEFLSFSDVWSTSEALATFAAAAERHAVATTTVSRRSAG